MQIEGSGRAGVQALAPPWRRVPPSHRWNDLVLPDEALASLRGLAARLDGQTGGEPLRALFVGEHGTGKSMAAQVLATEHGAPLIELDVAAALTSGPAGLAAALWHVIREGERDGAVLVLDGAGASADPQAHGPGQRIAASALRDLLARCAGYPGLVIFCTTVTARQLAGTQALSAVVHFPFPDASAREQMWRRYLPPGSELADEDIEYVARWFRLPGAAIRATAAAATQAAAAAGQPPRAADVGEALQRAYRGALVSESTRTALEELVARESGPDASR